MTLDPAIIDRVRLQAEIEGRTFSSMCERLLLAALKGRADAVGESVAVVA